VSKAASFITELYLENTLAAAAPFHAEQEAGRSAVSTRAGQGRAQEQRPRFMPDKERQRRWIGFVLGESAVDGGVAANEAAVTAGWTCVAKQLGLHVQKQ
jgi:hypothetical protein